MIRSRSIVTVLASAAVVPALILSACGDDDSNSSSSTTTKSNSQSGQSDTVDVASSDLGNILVDSQGRTLYLFLKDSGTTSECSGECATDWPPVTTKGTPTTGSGAEASMVGTTQRSDGTTQVTYNGHPVYRFEGDKKSGDTNGEGLVAFGAAWYAMSPAGDQVTGSGSSSSGGSGSSSSGSGSSSGGSSTSSSGSSSSGSGSGY
jgi:predicted lipoprotein with Yx(FWY)xxD motif